MCLSIEEEEQVRKWSWGEDGVNGDLQYGHVFGETNNIFPVGRRWWINRRENLFRESVRVRRQEPCESQFIEWKTFDDHLYLFLRKVWASCWCDAIRMEWSGQWWVYWLLIYIAKGRDISCVLIGILAVAVAMESASIFSCAFVSNSLYFILSSWCPLTCSIVKFSGNNWSIILSACWWYSSSRSHVNLLT